MDYQELKQLEDDLWEAVDQLRANSTPAAGEYSMPVLGLIFLRHATTRFDALLPELIKIIPARNSGALRAGRTHQTGFPGQGRHLPTGKGALRPPRPPTDGCTFVVCVT